MLMLKHILLGPFMKTSKKLTIGLLVLNSATYSQTNIEEFIKQREEDFSQYKASVTKQYEQYELQEKQAFEKYKQEIEEKWLEFKESGKKEYVEYNDEKTSRSMVDFDKGEITVEVLLKPDEDPNQAIEKLQEATEAIVKSKADDKKPILLDQLESSTKENITPENVEDLSKDLIADKKVSVEKNHFGKDDQQRTKYTVVIPLMKNHLNERAKRFEKLALKYSRKFKLDPAIVLALIETESAFNPKAKSHIPAYGLMQLVPKSGARDAYLYVYKEDKFLDKHYLYKPENNIELGCAYLAKIRYVYFKEIEDDQKAIICAIPAYNTGIGNVSKTLSGTTKLKDASISANNMTTDELYIKLSKDLKYKEARDYLTRVWERKEKYKG